MGDARRLLRRLSEKAGASQTLSRPIDSEPPPHKQTFEGLFMHSTFA